MTQVPDDVRRALDALAQGTRAVGTLSSAGGMRFSKVVYVSAMLWARPEIPTFVTWETYQDLRKEMSLRGYTCHDTQAFVVAYRWAVNPDDPGDRLLVECSCDEADIVQVLIQSTGWPTAE